MELTFYDKEGEPVAYTEDGTHVYLFSGEAVAYIDGESIYDYSGQHLGWFEDGWIRDHSGDCVFFTEVARGSGPVKPVKSVKPVRSVKEIKPVKRVKEIRPVKSVKSLSWSDHSGEEFFRQ